MSVQTFVLSADVPEDQAVAAQAAAASFVQSFTSDVSGAVVVAATFGGTSLLPTPQEALQAALDQLRGLTSGGSRPTANAVQEATDAVDRAARALELALTAAAAPAPGPAPAANPDAAAVLAATTVGLPEEPAPAGAGVPALPDVQPAPPAPVVDEDQADAPSSAAS